MSYKVQIDNEIREATAEEIERIKATQDEHRQQMAALEQIAAAKASAINKLSALGLTEEEVGALLGR